MNFCSPKGYDGLVEGCKEVIFMLSLSDVTLYENSLVSLIVFIAISVLITDFEFFLF
jgi:hypothetical protein